MMEQEPMSPQDSLTHVREDGSAHMVDVSSKAPTPRTARAGSIVVSTEEVTRLLRETSLAKGDALAAARLAGIMAAKRTGELIPLCHPLALDAVTVEFVFEGTALQVTSRASLTGRTGVEMEAMTATSIALLTIYDMAKAIDKGMMIEEVLLLEKTGGKSGTWRAAESDGA